ncbi:MAG: hypothetical protein NC253_06915 [Ruminococcus sp.]|nr:hypothetical protein [Ruminococcus sp.]MCM1380656.1 hypothetical protein [Muribaculaceae bacterium]MCM1479488.1 hypothetical protein [Muribaculaceae bacterium]
MEQLLSYKHIPIKVEVKVQRAELRPVEDSGKTAAAPSVKVSSKQGGGLRLQAEPYRVDLSETRNYDAYIPSANTENGFTLTYEAVAKLADGSQKSGEGSASQSRKLSGVEEALRALPKNKSRAVSYNNGTLSINYQMNMPPAGIAAEETSDPVEAIQFTEFEFIPGSIEFIITQMPELDIEYLGDPIYFPRSADPNYEPPLDIFA